MAPTQRASARAQRLTSLAAIAMVAASVALAFGRVFQGRPATLRLLAFAMVSGLIAWALERRSLFLATVASVVLLVTALGMLVVPQTLYYGLPSLDTLQAIADAAAEVGSEARARVSPAEPVVPLVFAAATATWAAVFSCHSLAFRAGSPLLALVPPAALVAFADSVLDGPQEALYGIWFLAAALAVVFADSLRRIQGWGPVWTSHGARHRLLPAAGRGGRRIAVGTLAIASLAPFVIPGYGSKAVIDISPSGNDGLIHVSPLVSVGSELTRGEPREVFVVQSRLSSYWRMTSLETFDGLSWQMSDESSSDVLGGSLGGMRNAESFRATFTASNDLGFPWMPAPYRPDSVSYAGGFSWAPRSHTLTAKEPLSEGDSYIVTASFPSPSIDDLRFEEFPDLSLYPDAYPELVGLPEDIPPQIGELAREWTAGADSTYDQIIAIQQHLTDASRFTYSTDVSFAEDSHTLVDFLTESKTGFCQQFASAMAVMLRTLGIPARVAVGFTPGASAQEDNTHRVMTDDLHAWVEVLFPTYGWLPFEPTPGRANPAASTYMPRAQGGTGEEDPRCLPPSRKCQSQQPVATPKPPRETGDGDPNDPAPLQTSRSLIRSPIGVAATVGALLVLGLAGIPVARRLRRWRRFRRAGPDPRRRILATYGAFLDATADLGLMRRAGETPWEYAERVRHSGRLTDGHLDRLTSLATHAAYAASHPSSDDALDADADAKEALEELRGSASLLDRLSGAYGVHRT